MATVSIAVAERESGISKDTLRIWEKRYGFPAPQRDAHGDRCYDAAQLEALRLIKRLLDAGMRPSRVVGRPLEELAALVPPPPMLAAAPVGAAHAEVLARLAASDLPGLRESLGKALMTEGLVRFVCEQVAALNTAVGEAWARGAIGIAQEHLYTEEVVRLIRSGLHALPDSAEPPRVLLTTLPGEQHGLGLLMAEVVIRAHGATAINVGIEVPVAEIAAAASAHGSDVVALSFSQARNAAFVAHGVRAVRQQLTAKTALWIGGQGAQQLKRVPAGVHTLHHLADLGEAVTAWRSADRRLERGPQL